MAQTFFIGVAGNIGVGKTTLTRELAQELGWKAYFEPVIENPYLDDFYNDMRRWAFHLQIYFLSKRFQSQLEINQSTSSCIQDRTIYEDVEIFAYTLHQQGSMDDRDYENYRDFFAMMTDHLRPPDLIIYLRADVDTLLQRIASRGRDCEKTIKREYLESLNQAYEHWASSGRKITRFAVLDSTHFDPNYDRRLIEEAKMLLSRELIIQPSLLNIRSNPSH
jgi:deoxyadenosine/deoxycytidine kinase